MIQQATRRLVHTYRPVRVYLFGSYAWGKPDQNSDLDLLVVVPDSYKLARPPAMAGHLALSDMQMAKDIVVTQSSRFAATARDRSSLYHKIQHEGIILYQMVEWEKWLFKAEHDIEAARRLTSDLPPILDVAAYHTQQCAEKALKGFLSFKGAAVQRTHDLSLLVSTCASYDPEFQTLEHQAAYLNGFSTQFRYPGDELEPEAEEVNQAIQHANDVLTFVKARMYP